MKVSRVLKLALPCAVGLALIFASVGIAAETASEESSAVVIQTERGLIDWSRNYIESKGTAVAPTDSSGAQARALARRGAIVDMQRNLLEFLVGVHVDARTVMDDFMASDGVRSEVHGMIRNIELLEGQWDGEAYTMTGRLKLPELLVCVTPEITARAPQAAAPGTTQTGAPSTSGRFTGLVIDGRHLPIVPSLNFYVTDESGREVYGISFADPKFAATSGLATYFTNLEYARGELRVATNPIVTRAARLSSDGIGIVIPNSAAARVRGSSYDFRKECKVIIVVK